MPQSTQHRAGKLKQTNKKHKLRGTTKPSRDPKQPSGKVNSVKNTVSNTNQTGNRQQRINRQKQIIQEKRLNSIHSKRQLNAADGNVVSIDIPKIVTLLPLTSSVNLGLFAETLINSGKWTKQQALNKESTNYAVLKENSNRIDLFHNESKTFFTFLAPTVSGKEDKLFDIIECVNVSDSVILLCDYDELLVHRLIDENGEKLLEILQSFGSSGVMLCFSPTSPNSSKQFSPNNVMKQWKAEYNHLIERLNTMLGEEMKAVDIRDHAFIRSLQQDSKHSLRWRHQRTYMLVDELVNVAANGNDHETCTMTVRGLLRGAPMFLHSLVHVTNVGAGKILCIRKLNKTPYNLRRTKRNKDNETESAGTSEFLEELFIDHEKQDALTMEASHDQNLLAGEQTWPQDEEMQGGENHEDNTGDDDEMTDDDGDENGDDQSLGEEDLLQKIQENRVEGKSKQLIANALAENGGKYLEVKSPEENEEEDDDYVDDYDNMSARQRFARYRSLESMRSSYWHPKENLPPHYSKIFQFEDFKSLQKRLSATIQQVERYQHQQVIENKKTMKKQQKQQHQRKRTTSVSASNSNCVDDQMDFEEGSETGEMLDGDEPIHNDHEDDDAVSMGIDHTASNLRYSYANPFSLKIPDTEDFIRADAYVEIVISDIPRAALERKLSDLQSLLSLFVLHANEQKLSVCHFTVRRVKPIGNESDKDHFEKIKSKEELLFYCGFRGFWTRPVFSESNLNSDKHKFLRYLPREGFTVASGIMPVNMSTMASVVILRKSTETERDNLISNQWKIIAAGNALSTDPDRIMLKRIILTGNPIRVKKKTAVVKHMFFDPLDVRWFKPAELTTIHGLRGHIKESVGTHGLYKAVFNAAITQNDMVKLVLYKRIFPKLPEQTIPFTL